MMEAIDFSNFEYAFDRVIELANCIEEKQNLVGMFYNKMIIKIKV